MPYTGYVIAGILAKLLDLELLLLLIRALMSWVMPDERSRVWQVVYGLTEPLIAPIRSILSRFSFVQACPIDLSYLAAYLMLQIIRNMLV